MSALEKWVQQRLAALLLWMLAGGYIVVLAELVITAHVEGIQLVAVVASALGLVLTLAALGVGRSARYAVAALLLLLSVTGLLGTYQHYLARAEVAGEAATPAFVASTSSQQPIALRAQEDDGAEAGEAEGESKSAPPPLAPLSLSGLSVMAATAALGLDKARG